MTDPEFNRRLSPQLKEVRSLGDRIMTNENIPEIAAALRPSREDWEALFVNLELAQRAHQLYETSVAPVEGQPVRSWNIGPVVWHPYGVAQYYRYEIISAYVDDFESNTKLSRRFVGAFPTTYKRLVQHMRPKQFLCGVRLTYGLMAAPNPDRKPPPQYQTEKYQYREGDFAPCKTFTILANVRGQWKYFPKKIIFHALSVKPDLEDSTSEPDFFDSTSESESEGDDEGEGGSVEGGADPAADPNAQAGWFSACSLQ